MTDLFPPATKEEIKQRQEDRQKNCKHDWGSVSPLSAGDVGFFIKHLNFLRGSVGGFQTCNHCKLMRSVTVKEMEKIVQELEEEEKNWFRNLGPHGVDRIMEQCTPHKIAPCTDEEWEALKKDPTAPSWFNLKITCGTEWIWKKYSIMDNFQRWRTTRSIVTPEGIEYLKTIVNTFS